MKRYTLILVVCMCLASLLSAQDVIVMRNGDEIKGKVMEITLDEVKYKMVNNPDGPDIVVYKKDVFMIKYKNGTKDVFDEKTEDTPYQKQQELLEFDSQYMYDMGKQDARRTYRGYRGQMMLTELATICLIVPGIIVATNYLKKPLSEKSLKMDNKYRNNADYEKGYTDTALKMRRHKVWVGFGFGGALCLGGVGIGVVLYESNRPYNGN